MKKNNDAPQLGLYGMYRNIFVSIKLFEKIENNNTTILEKFFNDNFL